MADGEKCEVYLPSEAEIAEACEQIQSAWTYGERLERRKGIGSGSTIVRWTVPTCRVSKVN